MASLAARQWVVLVSVVTLTVAAVAAAPMDSTRDDSAEAIALFRQNKIDTDDLSVVRVLKDREGTHVHCVLAYRGLPVFEEGEIIYRCSPLGAVVRDPGGMTVRK